MQHGSGMASVCVWRGASSASPSCLTSSSSSSRGMGSTSLPLAEAPALFFTRTSSPASSYLNTTRTGACASASYSCTLL